MTTEQSFNAHTLVDFFKLTIGDSDEIHRLETELQSNGWCFIRLADVDGQLAKKIFAIQTNLTSFFSQKKTDKSQYKSSTAFGYSRVGHKEGIKVLTDQYGLGNHHHRLPDDVEQSLQSLAFLMRHLTDVLKSIIFRMPTLAQSPARGAVELSPLTMLDIVHYYNKRTGPPTQPAVGFNTDEVNCVPHFDPGLFSLSILSTCDGLQLKDQAKDQWIDGPINSVEGQASIGVVWLGEAASLMTGKRFKSGIHRVVYPRVPHQPRLTIWQEVCTVAQVDPLLNPDEHTTDNVMNRMEDERGFPTNKYGRQNVRPAPSNRAPQDRRERNSANSLPGGAFVTMTNQPNSMPLQVQHGGETVHKLMKRVEHDRGISMSKSGRRYVRPALPDNDVQQVQNMNNANFLPDGASVTMVNQPNSMPLKVQQGGETVNKFMRRVENERGLSMSKSGVEHLDVQLPFAVKKSAEQSNKKPSLLSKFFK